MRLLHGRAACGGLRTAASSLPKLSASAEMPFDSQRDLAVSEPARYEVHCSDHPMGRICLRRDRLGRSSTQDLLNVAEREYLNELHKLCSRA